MRIELRPPIESALLSLLTSHDISELSTEEAYNRIPFPYSPTDSEADCIFEYLSRNQVFGKDIHAVLNAKEM